MKYNFPITRTTTPKAKPDPDTLRFGQLFTDHMFIMEYTTGKGWHDGKIVPYAPLQIEPAAAVFHYAQEMFEGLKAYKSKDGRVLLFRPDMNAKRTTSTNERMCIPHLDEELMVEAIKAVVNVDKDWIPEKKGTSLYIRPFIIADEPFLGVRPSDHYLFMVILSPVGPYYEGGLAPTKIFVEDDFVRATPGGTGFAKIGGNYAAGMKSQEKAHEKGYEQVLWLDGVERKYVEEIGTSNAFFKIHDEVITAPLSGTILPGITRDSVINLLKQWGIKVSERRLTIEEVFEAGKQGKLIEMFATGTAAVISPVGELSWKDEKVVINNGEIGELSQKLYDELYGLQIGEVEDTLGWTVQV
ncbi:branched-chain amino acid aminotransferase [Clostridium aminobutyricum]|uniref:Branched-chain-amino-acid aminotransferase n=1 Tax=Clostridium aminobutyricum TaxID=33953 RepID=A0A939D6I8_CLOAM|nr:branched-chain amino acid aminotransferase [Clostridium aminobutyricum]MBN7772020.1 branched-chain amino acid aminotransferase [Clostridium aminobutyricum]